MKKILKALLILIGFLPMVCNADSEEVRWRWYKEVESDVHYEKDAKQICEYFDEHNYILGDIQYSLKEPENIEGREVLREDSIIELDTRITNRLFINNFHIQNNNVKVYEIEVFDINDNKLNYNIEISNLISGDAKNLNDENYDTFIEAEFSSYVELIFNKSALLKGIKIVVTYEKSEDNFEGITFSNYINHLIPTKSFQPYQTTNMNSCEENICKFTVITPNNDDYYDTINVKVPIYKYKDKYYKCFTNKKIYVPGYYKELTGFTKDENDYIKVNNENNKDEDKLTTPIYNNNNIKLPDVIINNKFPDTIKFEPYSPVEKEPVNNTCNITVKEDENKNAQTIALLNKLSEKNDKSQNENEIIMYLLDMLKENIKSSENTSLTESENRQISYNDKLSSNVIKTDENTENNNSYLYLIVLMIITFLVTITYFVKKSRAK